VAETSGISWTDATFNPWIGCTKVSPACDNCYAERDNARRKWVDGWGAGVPRRRTKSWGDPLRWNRKAAAEGATLRVFCASLADIFDNEVPEEWRDDLWQDKLCAGGVHKWEAKDMKGYGTPFIGCSHCYKRPDDNKP
jgi:protein gp37